MTLLHTLCFTPSLPNLIPSFYCSVMRRLALLYLMCRFRNLPGRKLPILQPLHSYVFMCDHNKTFRPSMFSDTYLCYSVINFVSLYSFLIFSRQLYGVKDMFCKHVWLELTTENVLER